MYVQNGNVYLLDHPPKNYISNKDLILIKQGEYEKNNDILDKILSSDIKRDYLVLEREPIKDKYYLLYKSNQQKIDTKQYLQQRIQCYDHCQDQETVYERQNGLFTGFSSGDNSESEYV